MFRSKHRQTKDSDEVSKVVSDAKLFTFSAGECETVPVVETLRRSIGCRPISQSALVASPFTDELEHPFAFSFSSYTLLRKERKLTTSETSLKACLKTLHVIICLERYYLHIIPSIRPYRTVNT